MFPRFTERIETVHFFFLDNTKCRRSRPGRIEHEVCPTSLPPIVYDLELAPVRVDARGNALLVEEVRPGRASRHSAWCEQ